MLRAGALPELFDAIRAPSTIGSWLRSFKWHNVRQLDAVSRELLKRLWDAGAGPADPGGPLMLDLDSTIVAVHGRSKQGAAFGYTNVRGYHPQLATLAETGQVIFSRLRGGAAGAARGAKSLLTETISPLRHAGATGELTVRADSAFYSKSVLGTAVKLNVRFSVTVRQDRKLRAAIQAIAEHAWAPIPYWLSTPEVSGADVAETTYTCFSGTTQPITVRLIVRRVRPTPGSQLALFTDWDYHAFVTDRAGDVLELEAEHRRHAIIEQTIAELKSAAPALRTVHRQRRLARPIGDGPQPRPRRRSTHRHTAEPRHRGHLAPHPVHHPRTARALRPAPAPTTTSTMALGRGVQHRPDRDHRDPRALLNGEPRRPPTTQGTRRSRRPGGSSTPAPQPPTFKRLNGPAEPSSTGTTGVAAEGFARTPPGWNRATAGLRSRCQSHLAR